MHRSLFLGTCLVSIIAAAGAFAAPPAASDALSDVIIVSGVRPQIAAADVVDPIREPFEGADATRIFTRVPGGARVSNGALSGQVQYRGLFGARLNLKVDGQRFATGGPNLMDPPFHYAPTPLLAYIEVDRGVSPVRDGPGLAGGADAVFKRVDFASSNNTQFSYDITGQALSTDESYAVGGIVGAANDRFRFNALGAFEKGDNMRFPGGTVATSFHERSVWGAAAGAKFGEQEFSADFRRQHTDPTGNPPFPMDIDYFDTDFARLGYRGEIGSIRIESHLDYVDVAHGMNNFEYRPAPADPQLRETFADATTYAGDLAAIFDFAGGAFRVGGDFDDVDRAIRITNPSNSAFFIDSFNDVNVRRFGGFAEWTGEAKRVNAEIGVRVDSHDASVGPAILGPALPMGPALLAAAFNASDRDRANTTVDAVARFWTDAGDNGLSLRATLARKTRVPSYLERFGWLPTNASSGLADGNVYVGDMDLRPETAWIAEAGFDLRTDRLYFRPTAFVRYIDNYIQGVPFDATIGVADTTVEMVAAMNGDATPLRFANVDARLIGFDFDGGVKIAGGWRTDVVGSFVQARRRDTDDYLYRVAPPNMTASLTYEASRWSVSGEARLVADQRRVSATNSEAPTDGYAIFNLIADFELTPSAQLSFGVENVFDKYYQDHLSGYNRIAGSDVPLGERIPGAGRGVFVRLNLAN